MSSLAESALGEATQCQTANVPLVLGKQTGIDGRHHDDASAPSRTMQLLAYIDLPSVSGHHEFWSSRLVMMRRRRAVAILEEHSAGSCCAAVLAREQHVICSFVLLFFLLLKLVSRPVQKYPSFSFGYAHRQRPHRWPLAAVPPAHEPDRPAPPERDARHSTFTASVPVRSPTPYGEQQERRPPDLSTHAPHRRRRPRGCNSPPGRAEHP